MINLTSEQISQGLKNIEGVAEFYLVNGDFENITWLSDGLQPTLEEVQIAYDLHLQNLEAKEILENERKVSAENKLLALGLTLEEIRAFRG